MIETEVDTSETHGTVEFLLRRMKHRGDLPAFSQNVIEINKKLSSLHAINFSSSGELAGIILKDISLTNKLLKVVNSSLYGNISGKVTTISRAVFLLGAEKIRTAAASLMIFDHMQNKRQAVDLQDASVFSFFSAVVARNVAEKMMLGSAEEVFICSLLHNLGKHLVICYFPEEYQEIKRILSGRKMDEQRASRAVLGVSYSELGKGVARSWSFPQSIIDSMDGIDESEPDLSRNGANLFKYLANYSEDLCTAAITEEPADRERILQNVSLKYKSAVPCPVEETFRLIAEATGNLDEYAEIFKIDASRSAVLRRLSSFCEDSSAVHISSGNPSSPLLTDSIASGIHLSGHSSAEERQEEMLKGCLAEINELLCSECSISDAVYMILETMYRAFHFNRVLFCMLDQTRSKFSARFGFGENLDNLLDRFEFKVSRTSDYFNMAVLRKKDIVIHDTEESGVWENLPIWYVKIITARSFLIYPLIIKEKCIGLLYADRKITGILNDDQRDYMNILRDKTIWAILHKH
jgi:eukaryotic-like serine/threonine-protein kinase